MKPAAPTLNIDIPAQVEPYVRALGIDGAIAFLLAFGGGPTYIARRPEQNSAVRDVIGEDGIRALATQIQGRIARVPLAKPWIARVRFAQDVAIVQIARELHVSDETVRKWLVDERAERLRQLSLPF
ncbi:hypothetical protein [Ancylobacter lacus]|uniref:hypothetical protein n=1 Tax=Ancylobacter lacus TaxID=2579970 RepID=UPI001BD1B3F6|nr:hypothetical protein [Ancylobacter lacus]MBS7539748.1 hypothetical protein [Ancylobacter lacus]